jgi:N-acetylneuraminate synthase
MPDDCRWTCEPDHADKVRLGTAAPNRIGDSVFIVAEAGVNHNGSLQRACRMIESAAEAGADAVKFQTFNTTAMVARNAPKADYQLKTTAPQESQFDMIRKLELSPHDHEVLMQCCRANGVTFMSSPFDTESVDLLAGLGLDIWKIPSGEITNRPLLRKVGALGQQILLSTGMADLGEVEAALNVLEESGTQRGRITLLHCTTQYPAPAETADLRTLHTLAAAFPGTATGYSDHTLDPAVPVAAAALGATVLEKHFTLDRALPGPDHAASLDPVQFAQMVDAVRTVERALGSGVKKPSAAEIVNRCSARKSVVAAVAIHAGQILDYDNLAVKRPGNGISPMQLPDIVGRTAHRDFAPDELIVI